MPGTFWELSWGGSAFWSVGARELLERSIRLEPATFSLAKRPASFRHAESRFIGLVLDGRLEAF